MEYIHYLTYIAIVLLIGTLASFLAYYFKTSEVFILLLTGMILGNFGLLVFEKEFIIIVGILALIFVVFSSSLKFKISHIKKSLPKAIKINTIYFVFCLVFLSLIIFFIFDMEKNMNSILVCILISTLAYGTDPTVILDFFKNTKNKLIEIIELESLINTPITVILSLLIISWIGGSKLQIIARIDHPIVAFLQLILVGAVIGAFLSWTIKSILKNNYFTNLADLCILTSAIIAYVGAEYFGGSGVVSIVVFGIALGNSNLPHIIEIEKFESKITNIIKILAFMLLGTILKIETDYILKGTFLFLVYLVIRFVSIWTSKIENKNIRHIFFMTLNVPKGVDVAVVLLLLASFHNNFPYLDMITNITMLMILYSIAVSSIVGQFSNYFLSRTKKNVKKN